MSDAPETDPDSARDKAVADAALDALTIASPEGICGPGFWMWVQLTVLLLNHGWTLGELTTYIVHTAETVEAEQEPVGDDMPSPHAPGHA